jgi:multidrug efflux pump subunit AcrA (membrane-fusion protein)
MYVEVQLVTAVHADALLVPKRALVYDNDQVYLFRVKGREEKSRRVERLLVEPRLENADFIEPGEGLALRKGDRVIIAGQSGLKDGGLIRLPEDPEPPKKDDKDQKQSKA